MLEETKAKPAKEQLRLGVKELILMKFREVSLMLDLYKFPEISADYGTVARALIDFKKLGYDPKAIVAKYEK